MDGSARDQIMTKKRIVLITLFFIFYFSITLNAAIYSYRDKDGNVHITNDPPDDSYKIVLTSSKRPKGFKNPIDTGHKYGDTISIAARQEELPCALLMAIIKAESNFNPRAVSSKGARGLMQLMPALCKDYNVTDPFDVNQNIRAGSRYFRKLLEKFRDVSLALAAYNAGPGRVKQYKGIPPFKETKNYIKRVYWYYDYYQKDINITIPPEITQYFEDGFKALKDNNLWKAAKNFKQVIIVYPDSPEAYYNLAIVYERMSDLSQCIDYYHKALMTDPYFKEAYYNLAIILERMNMNDKAVSAWQEYLNYEFNLVKIDLVKKYIKELRKLNSQQ
ncbi:soluble lytic murein transglycosylase [Candidatus Magnetomoraceae bacterium gMMP-15]